MHGVIFSDFIITNEILNDIWQYGYTDTGKYCNERTINYIIKYVTKIDTEHKDYKPDIFCSAGIGRNYIENEFNKQKHAFKGKDTIQTYTLKNGQKIALPKYYKNHLWTDEQRDQLWTDILDKDRTFVRGIEIRNISGMKGYNEYLKVLQQQQIENLQLGYGSTDKIWNEKEYKITFDMLNGK